MVCLEQAYDFGKKLIVMWNDYAMQHIRLETSNLRKIEESRQLHIEEMDRKKMLRYRAQRQANYDRWNKSPDYDPKKEGVDRND